MFGHQELEHAVMEYIDTENTIIELERELEESVKPLRFKGGRGPWSITNIRNLYIRNDELYYDGDRLPRENTFLQDRVVNSPEDFNVYVEEIKDIFSKTIDYVNLIEEKQQSLKLLRGNIKAVFKGLPVIYKIKLGDDNYTINTTQYMEIEKEHGTDSV